MLEYYRREGILSIKPMKTSDTVNAGEEDAFRYTPKGEVIGKIVVTMPEEPQELHIVAVEQEFPLRSESSYLPVGGLGGLGHAISIYMVEHGAWNLIWPLSIGCQI